MPDYRLYAFSAAGHIEDYPLEFEAASDEEAIAHAQQFRDGRDMELWQRGRMVKAFARLSKSHAEPRSKT